MMKAVICPKYGPPEVLEIRDIPKPRPKENEVLVKVVATAVNSGDVRLRGLDAEGFMKFVMKLIFGFSKPRQPIFGSSFAGVVEEVGGAVTEFTVGQEVFGSTGTKLGGHAQYIRIRADKAITAKPANATFEEAAALPFGGQTAMYFLGKGGIATLDHPKVMIYGATGAVGAAAVQVAKHHGATVTAVCSSRGKDLAQRLGADHIVLYDEGGMDTVTDRFDIIFDAVGKSSKKACAPLLKPDGKFLSVASLDIASEKKEYLEQLRTYFEAGKYDAVVDKVYPLDQVVDAHAYVGTGRKKGNVVLRMVSN